MDSQPMFQVPRTLVFFMFRGFSHASAVRRTLFDVTKRQSQRDKDGERQRQRQRVCVRVCLRERECV